MYLDFDEKMKAKYAIYLILFALTIWVVQACSTEKNTFVNRTYHQTTAKYNGHFNARELLTQAMRSYRNNLKEDYYNLLPITPLPDETEVQSMYPAIDTAIVKTLKVISKHSMPSAEDVSKKKDEFNKWIDENWLTTGEANYYRREYDIAIKNFEYVRRFYKEDKSHHIATLWLAKCQLQTGDLTNATLNINLLEKALEESGMAEGAKQSMVKKIFSKDTEEAGKKPKSKAAKKRAKKAKKKAKKKEKDAADKFVEFPEEIRFDFEKTKAELALIRKMPDDAIKFLEEAVLHTKNKKEKGRVYFVLGQLYASQKKNDLAKASYSKVLKSNVNFEMNFNARINRAFMGGDVKIIKELNKMVRDAKYAEYKDQLYYALADISFQEGKKDEGIVNLNKSIFYNLNNPRQKGRSYEKLGDLSFADKNYVSAQKYYDSCGRVIPDSYPNAEGIRNKASKLADLVVAIETAQFEDSVQRIARMSPDERVTFAEKLIVKIKAEEAERARREAQRLKELQAQQAGGMQMDNMTGNKSYWNNTKLKADGFNEFKRQWGVRENEDNWRRKDKIVIADLAAKESFAEVDSLAAAKGPAKDSLTVDMLLANIPLSDSALASSNERLLNALYDAGLIYKDQLNEMKMAADQFENVLARKMESPINMSSAYQLYKIYEVNNLDVASIHKDYLLTYYPNSDYANYLRDPDYFVKKKEFDALSVKEYTNVLDRYNRGMYYPVIIKADQVIGMEKDNIYRSKYMILKALSLGQMNSDKKLLIPVLEQVIAEYPGSAEDTKAKEMLDIIKNGYSKNVPADFSNKSIFIDDEKTELIMMVFLTADDNSSLVRSQIGDFNKEFFSKLKLNTSSTMYENNPVILVKNFAKDDANKYMSTFKRTKKHLKDVSSRKIIYISTKNLKTLLETKKLSEYELFFEENY